MKIVFLTNTYLPHVGGVARSVEAFAEEYRRRGHQVLIVAPKFANAPQREANVVRILAIQNFNASDFSVVLPIPKGLTEILEDFQAQIIHSHHPFLLGMTAVRLARTLQLPLFFTHHTRYEQYTHYVPGDSPLLKRFVIELATRYANLANQVFAPSESIRELLLQRGVTSPIRVVPTGVQPETFAKGDGMAFRNAHGISEGTEVIGHVGRLAPEKNLPFLTEAVISVLQKRPRAVFLLVGVGPSQQQVRMMFEKAGLRERLICAGLLQKQQLAEAFQAMNVFAFASRSETQGMVLIEAMACGLPVVALDAPGVREVVVDKRNGRLLPEEKLPVFSAGLHWVLDQPVGQLQQLKKQALATAEAFSMQACADKALTYYRQSLSHSFTSAVAEEEGWEHLLSRIKAEWEIFKSIARAGEDALGKD